MLSRKDCLKALRYFLLASDIYLSGNFSVSLSDNWIRLYN